jgi:hypothetical protein
VDEVLKVRKHQEQAESCMRKPNVEVYHPHRAPDPTPDTGATGTVQWKEIPVFERYTEESKRRERLAESPASTIMAEAGVGMAGIRESPWGLPWGQISIFRRVSQFSGHLSKNRDLTLSFDQDAPND